MKEKNNFRVERDLDLDYRNSYRTFNTARTDDEDDGSWWIDEK